MSELKSHLIRFEEDVNKNEKLRPLLKKWDINVIIDVLDTEEIYTLIFRGGILQEIKEEKIENERDFVAEANIDVFLEIFNGKLNPTEAVLDGEMSTFGDEKDEDILDGIALVVWGI